jgi:hypothetical protein
MLLWHLQCCGKSASPIPLDCRPHRASLVIHAFSSPWPCDRRRGPPYSACKVSVLHHRRRQRETRHEELERGKFFEMRNVLHRLLHQLWGQYHGRTVPKFGDKFLPGQRQCQVVSAIKCANCSVIAIGVGPFSQGAAPPRYRDRPGLPAPDH